MKEVHLNQVHKDLRPTFKRALASGWKVYSHANGHLFWRNPDGRTATTPGTNIGGRNLQNALATLRRTGLDDEVATVAKPAAAPVQAVEESEVTIGNGATTSLGDALRAAAETATAPVQEAKMTVIDAIMQAATRDADRTFDIEWMVFKIMGHTLGAANAGSVSNALTKLVDQGRIRRVGRGVYKLADQAPTPTTTRPTPASDASVDGDMAALNALLDAMANAEGAIRRLIADREKIAKVRELLK